MLCEKIRQARKQKGLTQEQLAKMLNVKRAVISKYETGIVEPSLKQIQRIAEVLKVPVAFLLEWEESEERLISTGLSIEDVCFELALSPKDLKKILENNDAVSTEKIIRIAKMLTKIHNNLEKKLLSNFYKMNETGQKKAADLVEDLAKIPDYQKDNEEEQNRENCDPKKDPQK